MITPYHDLMILASYLYKFAKIMYKVTSTDVKEIIDEYFHRPAVINMFLTTFKNSYINIIGIDPDYFDNILIAYMQAEADWSSSDNIEQQIIQIFANPRIRTSIKRSLINDEEYHEIESQYKDPLEKEEKLEEAASAKLDKLLSESIVTGAFGAQKLRNAMLIAAKPILLSYLETGSLEEEDDEIQHAVHSLFEMLGDYKEYYLDLQVRIRPILNIAIQELNNEIEEMEDQNQGPDPKDLEEIDKLTAYLNFLKEFKKTTEGALF